MVQAVAQTARSVDAAAAILPKLRQMMHAIRDVLESVESGPAYGQDTQSTQPAKPRLVQRSVQSSVRRQPAFARCCDVRANRLHPAWRHEKAGPRQRVRHLLTGELTRTLVRSAGEVLLVASIAGGLLLAAIGCK